MGSLIEQAQNQKGLEVDHIEKMWKNIGGPKTPEELYDFLVNVLKDKQKVADAFRVIGVKFQDVGDQAKQRSVLGKETDERLLKQFTQLSPDLLRQLIQVVKTGKLPE